MELFLVSVLLCHSLAVWPEWLPNPSGFHFLCLEGKMARLLCRSLVRVTLDIICKTPECGRDTVGGTGGQAFHLDSTLVALVALHTISFVFLCRAAPSAPALLAVNSPSFLHV